MFTITNPYPRSATFLKPNYVFMFYFIFFFYLFLLLCKNDTSCKSDPQCKSAYLNSSEIIKLKENMLYLV